VEAKSVEALLIVWWDNFIIIRKLNPIW